jgi:ribose transport system substrate-binding protein
MKTRAFVGTILILILSGVVFAGGRQETAPSADRPVVRIAEGVTIDHSELTTLLGPVPQPSGDYTFGVILKTLINEHWQQMRQGYMDRAQELGVQVEVSAASSESALTEQLDLVETMLSRNYSALSVSPLAETNLVPALETAHARGIPIVNVDDARITAVPNVYVGANHRSMAVLAGEYFAQYFRGQGPVQVALLEGMAGSSASIQRVDGFSATVAAAPDLELVASLPGNWDRVVSLNAMESILQAHPNVRAVYAANDTIPHFSQ